MAIVPNFSCTPRTGYNPLTTTFTDLTTGADPVLTKILSNQNLNFSGVATQGKYALASAYNDYLYYSTDYGATWTQVTALGVSVWSGVAISSSHDNFGDKVPTFYACNNTNGRIYRSITEGTSWTYATVTSDITKVKCSADASVVVTAKLLGHVWVSTDYGLTWNERLNSPVSGSIYDLDVSDDSGVGSSAIIISHGTTVWISANTGITWTEQTSLPTNIGYYSVIALYWGDGGARTFYAGGSFFYSPLYKMTSSSDTGTWSILSSIGQKAWQGLSKGLVESAYDRQVVSAVCDSLFYLIDIYDDSYKVYNLAPIPWFRGVAVSNLEPNGCTVIVLSETAPSVRSLYVGKAHITKWYIDSGSGYVLINNFDASLQPFVRTLGTGVHNVKITIDDTSGTEEKQFYINVRAPVLNTVSITQGRIQSWTKQTLVSAPLVTKTHSISVSDGKIVAWTIVNGGTRPDPEVTRTVTILDGYIQP